MSVKSLSEVLKEYEVWRLGQKQFPDSDIERYLLIKEHEAARERLTTLHAVIHHLRDDGDAHDEFIAHPVTSLFEVLDSMESIILYGGVEYESL